MEHILWKKVVAKVPFVGIVCLSVILRLVIGLHSYSGEGKPPEYGDYEAQRHWMELTLNIPAKEWYCNTKDNDLSYWGIDYPPLSAYQSWASGMMVRAFDPRTVELHSSRGYESKKSKLGMRLSVIAADMIAYLPFCWIWTRYQDNYRDQILSLIWTTFSPALTLIDHGHFQYNGISLGLTMCCVCLLLRRQYVLGSIAFSGALNHKQISLYFAPAIFAHLLGACAKKKTVREKFRLFVKLGITVVVTFGIIWFPFMASFSDTIQVLRRIFPIQRGLYEDYVANFWCVSSLFIKWKLYFSSHFLAKICMITTMISAFPSLYMQFRHPDDSTLLLSMTNCSMAFFLFSFMVHEKSILFPLLPILMLISGEDSLVSPNIVNFSLLSMYPLVRKDELVLVYVAMQSLVTLIQCSFPVSRRYLDFNIVEMGLGRKLLLALHQIVFYPLTGIISMMVVHGLCPIVGYFVQKPFITDAFIVTVGFCFFFLHFCLTNYEQIYLRQSWKQKKAS